MVNVNNGGRAFQEGLARLGSDPDGTWNPGDNLGLVDVWVPGPQVWITCQSKDVFVSLEGFTARDIDGVNWASDEAGFAAKDHKPTAAPLTSDAAEPPAPS